MIFPYDFLTFLGIKHCNAESSKIILKGSGFIPIFPAYIMHAFSVVLHQGYSTIDKHLRHTAVDLL